MTRLTGQERARYVQTIFTRIANRYDRMNRLMTGGQDLRWRRLVIQLAHLEPGDALLDLGTGTGDLGREAIKQCPQANVLGADFTLEMMRVGREKSRLDFSAADALYLPFDDSSFDAVVSGFLMRNVIDLPQVLREQYRVLKPGGRIVILDTTRPKKNIFSPLIWVHMHIGIPTLGRLVSGVGEAYRYLPESTEEFLTAEELAAHMRSAGFQDVDFQRFMFGTIAIHAGRK